MALRKLPYRSTVDHSREKELVLRESNGLFLYAQVIKSSYQNVPGLCYTAVLEHWLTQTSPLPSGDFLIEALKSPVIDRGDIVSNIMDMFSFSGL